MVDEMGEEELSEFALKGIRRGLRDVKSGRINFIEKVAKNMGIKLD